MPPEIIWKKTTASIAENLRSLYGGSFRWSQCTVIDGVPIYRDGLRIGFPFRSMSGVYGMRSRQSVDDGARAFVTSGHRPSPAEIAFHDDLVGEGK